LLCVAHEANGSTSLPARNALFGFLKGPMKKKQFILGVGCQKGGTSWLYEQLKICNSVDMGLVKEYHVFDALYVPDCKKFINKKSFRKKAILKQAIKNNSLIHQLPCLLRSTDFQRNPDNYFKYFEALSRAKKITTVGDITPSYSALPIEALKLIRDNLYDRGFTVKVVFLMRDPIERCWSAVRMHRRTQLEENTNIHFKDRESEQLAAAYKLNKYEIRTRYEVTIKNLEAVFPSSHIYYGFYERLFTADNLQEMHDFFEIDEFNPNIEEKFNVSKKTTENIDAELRNDIFEFYRPTYEFCDERFDLRDIWPILKNQELKRRDPATSASGDTS